ncbi:MAG: thioredoxin domain-containing protein [Myxococcaceae bacterium]
MTSETTKSSETVSPLSQGLLLATSLASVALAVFQWMQLLVLRSGGKTVCGINEAVNCEAVWTSAFAERLHRLTLLPVAGLGLLWSTVALALCVVLIQTLRAGKSPRVASVALRVTASAGVAACITFAVASLRLGSVCLTCLLTYALSLLFAFFAFRLLPGPLKLEQGQLRSALAWCGGLAVATYLVLLFPALKTTPVKESLSSALRSSKENPQLDQLIAGLPEGEKLAVSASLSIYRNSSSPDVSKFGTRLRKGSAEAKVKIVDFTDTRCGHCAQLVKTLAELERVAPEGSISVEPRQFPLAQECNPLVRQPDPTGIRCAGARAQVCLESSPDFWRIRNQLFEEQTSLTPERVMEIASSGSVKREELETCMKSPATQEKLNQDVAYAALYNPTGTPIVVVNGRSGTPVGMFLYAMALAGGDANAPAFKGLPPPPAMDNGHAGHGHP